MARVKYIEEETTDNPVIKEAFERMRKKRGKVTNIYKALAHKPTILNTIGPFVAAVQQPEELDAKLKERIILRVSKLNRSAYCCHAHEQISAKMGFTPEQITEMNEPASAQINDAEKAALNYAEALTLNPGSIPIYVDYWESVVTALIEAGAPMDAIWAYELRQEHHFDLAAPPLTLDSGAVTTANGSTYDMADPEAKSRMIDEGLVYWTDTLRNAIRVLDPTALVTVGFFVPNEPNQVMGPDDTRLVRTHYFLRNTSADFVDLHHYAGNGVDDDDIWENFGLAGVDDIPIVLGEQGALAPWYSTEQSAAAAVLGLEVASCRVGFDGWLVWAWRGDEARDIWWADDGDGLIARVVAPTERPDPCAYGDFEFISFNVAPQAEITASSTADGFPPGNVADRTPAYWNSSSVAPQWVELRLAEPTNVSQIVLTLAQDPPGPSTHELWVAQDGGELGIVETFDGDTSEGDVFLYAPAEPVPNVTLVRVVTTRIGDVWPAWHEIEILTRTPPG